MDACYSNQDNLFAFLPFNVDWKQKIVELHDNGKPTRETMDEYDLTTAKGDTFRPVALSYEFEAACPNFSAFAIDNETAL